jgi:hypothetical protein
MAREAAVTYEVRSIAEVFWLAFKSLPEEDQGAFLRKLLDDEFWYEELADAVAILETDGEPTTPLRDVLEELKREGL